MTTDNQMIADILKLGLEDWVPLPWVPQIVKSYLPTSTLDELKGACLKVLRHLLSDGLVKVGDLTGEGGQFRSWDSDPDATIMQIEKCWASYGGPFDKTTGEFVCWLSNTEKGDEIGRNKTRQERP
jgi:hypothetical protein